MPQLAECRGPLSFHNELATAIRQELARARRDLDVSTPKPFLKYPEAQADGSYGMQDLKVEADDLDRAKDRAAASQLIASIQHQLDRSGSWPAQELLNIPPLTQFIVSQLHQSVPSSCRRFEAPNRCLRSPRRARGTVRIHFRPWLSGPRRLEQFSGKGTRSLVSSLEIPISLQDSGLTLCARSNPQRRRCTHAGHL